MTLDGAEFWFSNSAAGPQPSDGSGATCYVLGGLRSLSWPRTGDPFFSGTCDSGALPGQP
jgi:hypothetical protein